MKNDVVPTLLEAIKKDFRLSTSKNKTIIKAIEELDGGKATYRTANAFAEELGDVLSSVLRDHITPETLPDGRMYYNIASRILNDVLHDNFNSIADYSKDVQTLLNRKAGYGMKGRKAELNQSRIDGLIEMVSESEDILYIHSTLGEPITNFSQSIVDDTIRTNADFHNNLGLSPKIRRFSSGKCCEWCSRIAGVYNYEEVKDTGNNVFRRHRHCRCEVSYDPADGKRQNVHTKKWVEPEVYAGENPQNTLLIASKQFGKKAKSHMKEFGLDISNEADRKKFEQLIHDIYNNYDEVKNDIPWRGQLNPVDAYIKGDDVVLINKNAEFITIMKGGKDNERIKDSGK